MRIADRVGDITFDVGGKIQLALNFFNAKLIEHAVRSVFEHAGKVYFVALGVHVGINVVADFCRTGNGNQNVVERERHIVYLNVLANVIDINFKLGHLQVLGICRFIINFCNLHTSFYLRLNQSVGQGAFGRYFWNVGLGVCSQFAVIVDEGYVADCQFFKVDNKSHGGGVGNLWCGVGRRHQEIVAGSAVFFNKIFDCGAFELHFGNFDFAVFQRFGPQRHIHFLDKDKRVGFSVGFEDGAKVNVVQFKGGVGE